MPAKRRINWWRTWTDDWQCVVSNVNVRSTDGHWYIHGCMSVWPIGYVLLKYGRFDLMGSCILGGGRWGWNNGRFGSSRYSINCLHPWSWYKVILGVSVSGIDVWRPKFQSMQAVCIASKSGSWWTHKAQSEESRQWWLVCANCIHINTIPVIMCKFLRQLFSFLCREG